MAAKLHSSRHAYKRLLVHKCILVHSRECEVLTEMTKLGGARATHILSQ